MASREIRTSDYDCPKCGVSLKERWEYQDTGTLGGGKDWERVGRAYCPAGHTFEWSLAGPA